MNKSITEYKYPEIYLQSFELSKSIIKSISLFPKPTRYVLGHKLEERSLNFLLQLNRVVGPSGIKAQNNEYREKILKELSLSLDEFKILLRMAREIGAYSAGQYFEFNEKAQSIGKQIGGMIKSCKNN